MSSPPQIFISYAREDYVVVRRLYDRLKCAGYKPWMDKVDLPKGAKFAEAIPKVLRESDLFIVCLSTHSVNKRSFIQREINLALDIFEEKLGDDLYIFPVRLEACATPDRISQFNWTDLFGDEHEEEWQALLAALSAQAERLGKATPPLQQTVIVVRHESKDAPPSPPPTNPHSYIAPRDLEKDVPPPPQSHLVQSDAQETKEDESEQQARSTGSTTSYILSPPITSNDQMPHRSYRWLIVIGVGVLLLFVWQGTHPINSVPTAGVSSTPTTTVTPIPNQLTPTPAPTKFVSVKEQPKPGSEGLKTAIGAIKTKPKSPTPSKKPNPDDIFK